MVFRWDLPFVKELVAFIAPLDHDSFHQTVWNSAKREGLLVYDIHAQKGRDVGFYNMLLDEYSRNNQSWRKCDRDLSEILVYDIYKHEIISILNNFSKVMAKSSNASIQLLLNYHKPWGTNIGIECFGSMR